MKPAVSVVIVSFRSRDTLGPCLASLAGCRDRVNLEVVVVDNAPGDGTVEWIHHEHPWVVTVANQENAGFTRGVNQGLAKARGAFLFVLNPDCEVGTTALEELVRVASERPRIAAVAPLLVDSDGHGARSCGRFPNLWTLFCDHLGLAGAFPDSPWFGRYKYGGCTLESLDRVDWASGAALLIPRAAYAALGGLDENIFMYMEEVDWCRRAAQSGLEVHFVPQARIVHHGQHSSRQAPGETYLHNLRSRVYYFRKHFGAQVATVAKGILVLSLLLKWMVASLRAGSKPFRLIYARGMEVVWAA